MRITLLLLCALAACTKPASETATKTSAIRFEPFGHNFGDVEVGTSVTRQIKLSPEPNVDWERDYIYNVYSDCEAVSVKLPYLPGEVSRMCPNEYGGVTYGAECAQGLIDVKITTYTFDVTFRPPSPNQWNCRVLIDFYYMGTVALPISGVGKRPPLAIAVSPPPPAQFDFGTVIADTPSFARTVQIVNTGANAHQLGVTLTGAGFAIDGNITGTVTLPSLAELRLPVRCRPTGPGAITGRLTVTHQDPKRTGPLVFDLKCTGLDSRTQIVDTGEFAETRVGAPVDRTLQISNSGNIQDRLLGVRLLDPHPMVGFLAQPTTPFVLAPGNASVATVALRFAPIAALDDEPLGTLELTFENEPALLLPLFGRATLALPTSNPATVDFGEVCIGHTQTMPVMVLSNGNAGFEVQRIVQPISKSFTVTASTTLPANVAKDRENGVALVASVSPQYETLSTSTALVVTDAPTLATQNLVIKMQVQGLPEGVSARPKKVRFEPRDVGKGSYRKTVTLTNCDAQAVTLLSASFEGEDADSFNLVDELAEITLQPEQELEIDVQAIPRRGGELVAKLALETSGGTTYVELDGEGIAEPIIPAAPRDTYYTCSTGHGSRPWLVALALVFVLRRRRRIV